MLTETIERFGFARAMGMALAGQVVALLLVWSAHAAPRQAPPEPTGSGSPAPDCRLSAAQPALARAERPREAGDRPQAGTSESLARAHFMAGDERGALDVWNRLDQPRVRCLNVEGLVRTRRSVVIDYVGLSEGELLTADTFTRIERRLDELPIASRSRVRYDPIGDSATITPIVVERDLIPEGLSGWGVVGARALFLQEVRVDIAGSAGLGEVWSPSYRWSGNRPRAMLRFEAATPGRLPGILRIETSLESQAYRYPALDADVIKQPRQRVRAALSDWVTSWLRWEGGAAFDRIDAHPYFALDGSLNARALGDRIAVILTVGRWAGSAGRVSFTNGELVGTMRSTTRQDVPVIVTLVGVARAGDGAPLALWPGVSSGEGRNGLLRAHPLRRSSVITGEVFGRDLVFTTTEYEHPFHTRVGIVSLAGFVDAARAARRVDPGTSSPFHVDVGTGVRFSTSGTGKVRLDIGYGIRDKRVRLSAGYVVPWGRR